MSSEPLAITRRLSAAAKHTLLITLFSVCALPDCAYRHQCI